MSDEQPPEVGSRRRRREIREARERARTAQRENESAVRRLSASSAGDELPGEASPALFDQETQTPKDERARRPQRAQHPETTGEISSRRELRRLRTQQTPIQQSAVTSESEPSSGPGAGSTSQSRSPERAEESAEPDEGRAPGRTEPGQSAGTGHPAPVPAASSPSTPFEQVVAPHSAPSDDVYEEIDEDGQYYVDELHGEQWAEYEDAEEDWEHYSEGHIEHDEDGTPVLVEASDFGRGYQRLAPTEGRMSRSALKRRLAKRRRRNVTLSIALAGFAVLVIGFVLIVRSVLGGGGQYDFDSQAGETISFGVVEGDGLESVANRLVDEEIVASREAFLDSINDLDNEPILQPGNFEMREEMPAEDAVAALFEDGEASHYFNLNEGFRVDDSLAAMADSTGLNLRELEALNEDPQQFGLPEEAESLEGYLAAGEYRPALDATAEEVIEMAVEPTFGYFDELGISDEDEQWRTVIIASLITAEANHGEPDDYPVIAGAIENRLQPDNSETDGLLQIDAAVNYGLEGETGLHFTEEDRQDESNPYNTYQNEGLPPGPIATPSQDTLAAAANPDDTEYFYWVTVNIATGETRFNETYEQHQEDVEEFLRWCSEEDDDDLCGTGEVEAAEDQVEE